MTLGAQQGRIRFTIRPSEDGAGAALSLQRREARVTAPAAPRTRLGQSKIASRVWKAANRDPRTPKSIARQAGHFGMSAIPIA
jgi:hypothetical protein